MLPGIFYQVQHQDAGQVRVHPWPAGAFLLQLQADLPVSQLVAKVGHYFFHQRIQVYLFLRPELPVFNFGKQKQGFVQPGQTLQVPGHGSQLRRLVFLQVWAVGQQFELVEADGQGCLQFVGGIFNEVFLADENPDLALQHLVEGVV